MSYVEALEAAADALEFADQALNRLQRLEPDEVFAEKLDTLEMSVERVMDELMRRCAKVRGAA